MSTLNPKQLENAHACMKHLNELNFDAAAELLSPDFKQQYSPASYVPSHGRVQSEKEEFINMTKQISKTFDMKMQPPLDVIHGVDKVVFHIMCDGKSKSGSGKEFHGEYMLTFHFDDEKIVRINEFVDTKYNSEWFGALRKE